MLCEHGREPCCSIFFALFVSHIPRGVILSEGEKRKSVASRSRSFAGRKDAVGGLSEQNLPPRAGIYVRLLLSFLRSFAFLSAQRTVTKRR